MSKPIHVMALALVAMLFSSAAAGQGFDLRRLFFGAGVSQNMVSGLDNGAGYILNKNLKLRLEFVARDHVDSLQFNAVFYPW